MLAAILLLLATPAVPAPPARAGAAAERIGEVEGWTLWRFGPGLCSAVKGAAGAAYRPLGVGDHFQGPTPFVQISRRHSGKASGGLGFGIEARYVRAAVRARAVGEPAFAPVAPVWPERLLRGRIELHSAGYLYPGLRFGFVEETAQVDMAGAGAALSAVRQCQAVR